MHPHTTSDTPMTDIESSSSARKAATAAEVRRAVRRAVQRAFYCDKEVKEVLRRKCGAEGMVRAGMDDTVLSSGYFGADAMKAVKAVTETLFGALGTCVAEDGVRAISDAAGAGRDAGLVAGDRDYIHRIQCAYEMALRARNELGDGGGDSEAAGGGLESELRDGGGGGTSDSDGDSEASKSDGGA